MPSQPFLNVSNCPKIDRSRPGRFILESVNMFLENVTKRNRNKIFHTTFLAHLRFVHGT